jgi:hypothetical protein
MGGGESASYRGLPDSLTECVKACHGTLDRQHGFLPRQERWYRGLEFAVGRPVVDGTECAASITPGVMGGTGVSTLPEEGMYWKPPIEKLTHMITLPAGVEKRWEVMVSQAATYIHCLFRASPPMRIFVLVLAFSCGSDAPRFLVFHCGGFTASEEYAITRCDGLKEIARLLLTLASWGTAEEVMVGRRASRHPGYTPRARL